MQRREFIKSSICLGCAGAFGMNVPLVIAEDYKFTRREKLAMKKFIYKSVDELPKKIRVDVCNLCQLNCPVCWMRLDEEKILKNAGGLGYMKFEDFKKIIDENPFIDEIEISHNGEIFLNPDLNKILEYAFKKNVTLTAYNGVNMNTLSEETAEALVKYKFLLMVVSIDGTTPDVYKIYRRGGDFDTVINNIKMINKYKKKYNSEYPYMKYKFIVFGHNEHQIEDAKKIAKDLGMYIQFAVNYCNEYSPVIHRDEVLFRTGLSTLNSLDEKCFNDYSSGKTDYYFCKELFTRPQFNFNGDLLGCCGNYLKPFKGNILRDGMLKSLNCEDFIYSKLMVTNFKYGPKYDLPCNGCNKLKILKDNKYPIKV